MVIRSPWAVISAITQKLIVLFNWTGRRNGVWTMSRCENAHCRRFSFNEFWAILFYLFCSNCYTALNVYVREMSFDRNYYYYYYEESIILSLNLHENYYQMHYFLPCGPEKQKLNRVSNIQQQIKRRWWKRRKIWANKTSIQHKNGISEKNRFSLILVRVLKIPTTLAM